MLNASRVSELNNQSNELSTKDLNHIEQFKVALPPNELPEIVVVGEQTSRPNTNSSSSKQSPQTQEPDYPATVPFPATDSKLNETSTNKASQQSRENRTPVSQVPNRIEAADETKPSDPEPTTVETEVAIPLPVDELVIHQRQPEEGSEPAEAHDEAVFPIENFNQHSDRFDKSVKNIEARLESHQDQTLLITSPQNTASQQPVVFGMLTSLAQRNPTLKVIHIQAGELHSNGSDFQFSLGLGHVLTQANTLDEVVIPTTIDNVDYLAYSDIDDLSRGSFFDRASQVIEELKKHYDLVVLDACPASEIETLEWSALADSTYLVVKLNHDTENLTTESVNGLRKNGARLVGCVVIEDE